jgi:hypothetical protein
VNATVGSAAKADGAVVSTGDVIQLQLAGYDANGHGTVAAIAATAQGLNTPFCVTRTYYYRDPPVIGPLYSNVLGDCAADTNNCKGRIGNDGYNIDLYPCTDLRASPSLTCLLSQSCADILKINATDDDSRAITTARW